MYSSHASSMESCRTQRVKFAVGGDWVFRFRSILVILIAWLAYHRDWVGIVLTLVLGLGYWVAMKFARQILQESAKEPVKPPWWDELVDFPHPTEQSHSADILRRKYPRMVKRFYPPVSN